MNINPLLKSTLLFTGLPVEQDEYTGKKDRYIIFSYEDEIPLCFGDNRPGAYEALIHLQLITPKSFDYLSLKDEIRDKLEEAGFSVSSVTSFLGDKYMGTEKTRQTVYEISYTEGRRKKNG